MNPTTGAFTYTPSESMRQDADGSTTVTASNGVRTVTQTITVPVS